MSCQRLLSPLRKEGKQLSALNNKEEVYCLRKQRSGRGGEIENLNNKINVVQAESKLRTGRNSIDSLPLAQHLFYLVQICGGWADIRQREVALN